MANSWETANSWEEAMTAYFAKKLLENAVFNAVGDDLKEAMIAREVMINLCRHADDHPSAPIEWWDRLFRMLRAELLPQA
jgi:hypothetical protein